MKKIKFLSVLMAISAIAFTSCSKEEVASVEKEQVQENEAFQIVGTIKDGALTKTQYTENEGTYTFSWTYNDEIGLIVYKTDKTDRYILYADEEKTSTTFSNYAYVGNGVADPTTWNQSGFAIYPIESKNIGERIGIVRKDILGYGYKDSYSNITVTLSDSYDLGADPDMNTQLSCTPLIGTRVGTTNEYDFKTAVGILKITLNNVPTSATALRVSSPSTDAPLSGTFELVSGSSDIAMNKKVTGGQSRTINFTLSSEGTKTFYIPVPVGTIPLVDGKGLKIELLDGTDYPIFSRSYTKELTIVRNQITPVTLSTPEWKRIGKGKFIDNFLWHHMGVGTSTSDEVGYVDVIIQQNVSDKNKYRVLNPYATVLTSVGKTQDASHSDYLEFSIVDANTVDFVTTNTGFNSGNGIVSLKDVDGSYNKVVLGTADSPQIVQLAPLYDSDGSFKYTRNTRDNLIRIAFPGVYEQHSCDISIGKSDLSTGIDYSISAFKVTIYVSSSPLFSYYINQSAQTLPSTCSSAWVSKGANGNKTSESVAASSALTSSGPNYVFWTAWADDASTILFQGCKRFYYITEADAAAIAGTYKFQNLYSLASFNRSTWQDLTSTTDNRMVISISDNPTKGSVMITDLYGLRCDGTNTNESLTNANGQSPFGVAKQDGSIKDYMTADKYVAGSAVYGWLDSSTEKVKFESTKSTTFFKYDNVGFVLCNQTTSESGFSMTYDNSSTPVKLTYDARICIIPATTTGDIDGAKSLLWTSNSGASSQPSNAYALVGEKQSE